MGIGGKNRWKISFYRSSSRVQKKPPLEFICPISSSLMADPVIVSSGQTFERACAQACRDLGFIPLLSDGARAEFSALIPNRALKSAILNWCNLSGSQLPKPLEPHAAIELVRALVEAAEKGKQEEGEAEKTQKGIRERKAILKETLKGKDEEDEIEKTQKGIHEEETILKEAEKEEKEEDGQEKTHEGIHEKVAVLRETEERKDEEVEIEKTQNGIHEENPRTKKEKDEEGETEKTHIGIHKKEHLSFGTEKGKDEETKAEKTHKGALEKEQELLLRGVSENPDRKFSYAATEVNWRLNHFRNSSLEESVLVTPLPLATKPTCYSSPSNSTQKEDNEEEQVEEDIVSKLKSPQIFDQEEAVIRLRNISRTCPEKRVTLCTPQLLAALQPLLASKYSSVLVNAVAVVVNLSLERPNKVKLVRSGAVPPLINALRSGSPEAQEHAAGALFSLALEDENKMAIGVLGALPPLLHMLQSKSDRGRQDASLALYQLTLVQSNSSKLVKLGAIPALLALAKGSELACRVLMILCNLASGSEGRVALLDADTVEALIEMLRRKDLESSVQESCIATLFALSQSILRFKGSAKAAGAVEVLMEVVEKGSKRAQQKVKRMLMLLKEKEVGVVAAGHGSEEEYGGIGDGGERVSDSAMGEFRLQQHYQLHKGKNIVVPLSVSMIA
ncbi:U-box domain-containing protein 38 [Cinnamomum micranthum f. kanehirae]|uniref:RING-type E3 ubiquitin transferase n=1 Tax=Cinnamomum micranthum f. kanehirae TaxID=337451 RepID=A0A443PJR9_9MAGN|nr:U-box domain-containing protein 38 [Cinnamomum micranthum f. kanehirae]